MTAILIKDRLRETIEAASGGAQTVIYTTKGQPCFMNRIKKFDLSTIISGLAGPHPAFRIANVSDISEILIGTYPATISAGEMVSQPYRSPTTLINQATAVQAARFSGTGFHAMTNAEWAALQCLAFKNNQYPKGNNNFGRDSTDTRLHGTRVDGKEVGDTSGLGGIYSGSGPSDFRHDLSYSGISDLNGNINEMVTGLRCINGELQIIYDNNAASVDFNIGPSGSAWRAISGIDGTALTPNGLGTTPNAVRLSNSAAGAQQDYTISFVEGSFSTGVINSTTKPVSQVALNFLKVMGLYPLLSGRSDFMNISPTVVGYANRGGFWKNSGTSGINALTLTGSYEGASEQMGCRLAFYKI